MNGRTCVAAAAGAAVVVALVLLRVAWSQNEPATNAPAIPSGFETPLVRDYTLIRQVDDLTKRVEILEAAVKELKTKTAAIARKQ